VNITELEVELGKLLGINIQVLNVTQISWNLTVISIALLPDQLQVLQVAVDQHNTTSIGYLLSKIDPTIGIVITRQPIVGFAAVIVLPKLLLLLVAFLFIVLDAWK